MTSERASFDPHGPPEYSHNLDRKNIFIYGANKVGFCKDSSKSFQKSPYLIIKPNISKHGQSQTEAN